MKEIKKGRLGGHVAGQGWCHWEDKKEKAREIYGEKKRKEERGCAKRLEQVD